MQELPRRRGRYGRNLHRAPDEGLKMFSYKDQMVKNTDSGLVTSQRNIEPGLNLKAWAPIMGPLKVS